MKVSYTSSYIPSLKTAGAAALFSAALFGSGIAWAQGQFAAKTTELTFSGPVEVPGRILAAGTYVFKMALPMSSQNIVQIFDKDEKHLIGTVFTIPDYRSKPTGRTVLMFDESEDNSPQAIRAWFYPDMETGHEFVYPSERAAELARLNHRR